MLEGGGLAYRLAVSHAEAEDRAKRRLNAAALPAARCVDAGGAAAARLSCAALFVRVHVLVRAAAAGKNQK